MAITNRDHQLPAPNKERIRMLVEALRSGRYRQTKRKLARYDRKGRKKKYCCLGLACEVARLSGVNVRIKLDSDTDTYTFNANADTLPDDIMHWYGFDDVNPVVVAAGIVEDRSRITLAELNDEHNRNFKQIADIIEANYLKEPDGPDAADN